MNILSVFDGISCAYESLVKAGIEIKSYHACEIEKNAIKISKKNHPDIIHHGDIKSITGKELPPIDLLIGGSPCQDLSIANKDRQGLEGERSGLFWEWVRLWKECNPKYFILENVASMPKKDKQIITDTLGVEPVMFDASLVSAQSRKRYFWTNIQFQLPEDKGITLKDILQYDFNSKIGRDIGRRLNEEGKREDNNTNIPITRRIELRHDNKTNTLTSVQKDNLVVGCSYRGRLQDSKWVQHLDIRKDEKVSCLTTTAHSKLALVKEGETIRKLTPIECERLMGLPDNYTEGIAMTQRYKCLGNAFHVDVVSHILLHLKTHILEQ